MKKRVLMIILAVMLTGCGSVEAPAEPSESVEASVTVQEEIKATELEQKPQENAKPEAVVKTQTVVQAPAASAEPTITPAASSVSEPTPEPTATVKSETDGKTVESNEAEATTKAEESVQPEPTAKPKETVKLEAAETPKPIEKPKATEKPEPTPEPVHTCSWNGGSTTKEATCNSEGEVTYFCSCGKTKTETISKTSHNYVSQTTELTCTEVGVSAEVCTNCGDTKGESTIAALGHDYDKDYPMGNNTDCRGGSYYVVSCSRCGDVKDSGHDDALPCDFDETVVYEPTCDGDGVVEYTCKNCGFSKRESISATGEHEWVTEKSTSPEWSEEAQDFIYPEWTHCKNCAATK